MTRFNTTTRSVARLAALAALTISAPVFAAAGDWHGMTKAASSGIVDETDRDEVVFKSGRAQVEGSLDSGKVLLRYDIQPSLSNDTLHFDNAAIILRFRDNGPESQVIAKLKSYDLSTGDTHLIATLDSDASPPADDYQGEIVYGAPTMPHTPAVSFYVEVQLIKTGPGGKPAVGAVGAFLREM